MEVGGGGGGEMQEVVVTCTSGEWKHFRPLAEYNEFLYNQ